MKSESKFDWICGWIFWEVRIRGFERVKIKIFFHFPNFFLNNLKLNLSVHHEIHKCPQNQDLITKLPISRFFVLTHESIFSFLRDFFFTRRDCNCNCFHRDQDFNYRDTQNNQILGHYFDQQLISHFSFFNQTFCNCNWFTHFNVNWSSSTSFFSCYEIAGELIENYRKSSNSVRFLFKPPTHRTR